MIILKTPDEQFDNLDGYPFAPNFVTVSDFEGGHLQMHYVDEGPRDGQPVVMVHGNPTWSYEWRKVIPTIAEAGYRVIAIDLVGMGRSDKPSSVDDTSVARHADWLAAALYGKDALGLSDVHMLLHDWGGIVGLRAIADNQDKVASIVFSNTAFPTLEPGIEIEEMMRPDGKLYVAFQDTVRKTEDWHHWEMVSAMTTTKMPDSVKAGFAAPYPDPSFLCANRKFALSLPTRNDNPMLEDNWHALEKLKKFEKPFLCVFSDKDIVAPTGYKSVRPFIPGAQAWEPIVLEGGSHFLFEDVPDAYAQEVLSFFTKIND